TGPSSLDSSSGPVIAKTLSEELKKAGVTVKSRAELEVKGDYLDVVDKKTDKLAAQLKYRVMDRSGTVIVEAQRGIFGDATLSALFGATVHLPADADDKARDQEFRKALDAPKVHVAGNRVSSAANSPYAVEIL